LATVRVSSSSYLAYINRVGNLKVMKWLFNCGWFMAARWDLSAGAFSMQRLWRNRRIIPLNPRVRPRSRSVDVGAENQAHIVKCLISWKIPTLVLAVLPLFKRQSIKFLM